MSQVTAQSGDSPPSFAITLVGVTLDEGRAKTEARPTLVVCGAQDEWSTPAEHKALAQAIPGAELEIIEDAGHFVSVEQPEKFTAALRRFMRMGR